MKDQLITIIKEGKFDDIKNIKDYKIRLENIKNEKVIKTKEIEDKLNNEKKNEKNKLENIIKINKKKEEEELENNNNKYIKDIEEDMKMK